MSDVLIKAEHVSKKFCRSLKRSLWYGMKDVTHSLNPWARSQVMNVDGTLCGKVELRPDEFWALQGITVLPATNGFACSASLVRRLFGVTGFENQMCGSLAFDGD